MAVNLLYFDFSCVLYINICQQNHYSNLNQSIHEKFLFIVNLIPAKDCR